jgi:Na+/H+-dicarboxylate symporter
MPSNKSKNKTNIMILKIFLALILGAIIGAFLPLHSAGIVVLRSLITFSNIVSEFLAFFVPIAVLTLVMPSIIDLGEKATKMLIAGVALSFLSFLSIGFISLFIGYGIIPSVLNTSNTVNSASEVVEYTGFLPTIINPFFDIVTAMIIAFIFGIAATKVKSENIRKLSKEIESCAYKVLNSFIVPLLPFYIFAIMAKFSASGELFSNFSTFGLVILLIFIISNGYSLIIMFLLSKFTKRSFLQVFKAYISVYLVGFATRSSKASIPISLIAAEKINISQEVREFGVPLLSTTHMLGDMATQIFGALAFYYIFTGNMLPMSLSIPYILLLSSILIAAPGTPGGVVVTTKPFLTSFLGFPMPAAETFFAVGIANDSFATATNVLGDGLIVMILDSISKKIKNNKKLDNNNEKN